MHVRTVIHHLLLLLLPPQGAWEAGVPVLLVPLVGWVTASLTLRPT